MCINLYFDGPIGLTHGNDSNVGDDAQLWRSGRHEFKGTPLGLKGIPTLVRWGDEGEIGRLEAGLSDGSALRRGGQDLVRTIVEDFVRRSS